MSVSGTGAAFGPSAASPQPGTPAPPPAVAPAPEAPAAPPAIAPAPEAPAAPPAVAPAPEAPAAPSGAALPLGASAGLRLLSLQAPTASSELSQRQLAAAPRCLLKTADTGKAPSRLR